MKKYLLLSVVVGIFSLLTAFHFRFLISEKDLSGAWMLKTGNEEQVLLFADGYVTHTTYDKAGKKFIQSRGGTFQLENDKLRIQYEYSTADPSQIGQTVAAPMAWQQGKLSITWNEKSTLWNRLDDGNSGLSGLWQITARKEDGTLKPIHQTGTRKTIKILSATRFQWAAIDPGTKQFMGSGGGTYTFEDGKYTEHIEFFSRDSSRVGQSLTFDGKVEGGDWHHSGLSSKGDPIDEVWSRKK